MMEKRRSRLFKFGVRFGALALVYSASLVACHTAYKSTREPGNSETDRVPGVETAGVPAEPKPAFSVHPSGILEAVLSSSEVADGTACIVTIRVEEDRKLAAGETQLEPLGEPEGEFEGKVIPFFSRPDKGPGIYQAIVGVPHNHSPGPVTLVIRRGKESVRLPFEVVDGKYRSEALSVQGRKVNPLPSDIARIKRESAEIGEAYRSLTRERLWNGGLRLPIQSDVTSPFGTKRVYNGTFNGFHSGVDLKANIGTPIRSTANGRVVLAKDLFFTGKTVIVDHGWGFLTLYAHMSKIRVKKGQGVEAGQLLGLSGKTGRVSGPHLHWMAIVHQVKVSPLELMKAMN